MQEQVAPATPAPSQPVFDRSAFVAELQTLTDPAPAPESPAPAEPEAPAPAEEAPPGEPEAPVAEPEAPEAPKEDEPAPDPAPEAPKGDEKADAELDKRLAAITKAEGRAKDALKAERAEWERQKADLQASIDAARDFQKLKERAKYDPAGVLSALGFATEDFEPAARQIYAQSEAAKKDPRFREQTSREMREREHADRLGQMQQQIEKLQTTIAERDREAQVSQYLETVSKTVDDSAPIVRNMLNKNPIGTRERLRSVAKYLIDETGEVPSPKDVIATLEKFRRSELEESGVDVTSLFSGGAPKKTIPDAGEKRSANTLSNDLATPTKPRQEPKSREEAVADVRRALEAGKLD